ncbi:MAG: hypothetical protein WAZ19_07770 [Anaerolineae bacterium]
MKTYTFHVSLMDDPTIWRQVEIPATATLTDLHDAIQDVLDWTPDDDIAFLFGENPLESTDQYVIFDEDDDDDFDEDDEDTAAVPQLNLGDVPTPQSMADMLTLLETNQDVRAEVTRMMKKQLGIPAFMIEGVLNNMRNVMNTMPTEQMTGLLNIEVNSGVEPKNAATSTLNELALQPGQVFVYAYGDDEWFFNVHVDAVNEEGADEASYPLLLGSQGEAPEQYAAWDMEEDWDDADEDEDDL